MKAETKYILKAIIRALKTLVTQFQKIVEGKGHEVD